MSACAILGAWLVPCGRHDPEGPVIMSSVQSYMHTCRASLCRTRTTEVVQARWVAQGERQGERKGPG